MAVDNRRPIPAQLTAPGNSPSAIDRGRHIGNNGHSVLGRAIERVRMPPGIGTAPGLGGALPPGLGGAPPGGMPMVGPQPSPMGQPMMNNALGGQFPARPMGPFVGGFPPGLMRRPGY